jgi:MtN3 and saliva related transmembrane protein
LFLVAARERSIAVGPDADDLVIQVVGWLAAAATLLSSVPQVVRLLRTRNTSGVSIWTYTIWTSAALWWAAWGFSAGAKPSLAVNLACIPVLFAMVLLLRPTRAHWAVLLLSLVGSLAGMLWSPTSLMVIGSLGQILLGLPAAAEALRRDADLSGVAPGTWAMVILSGVLWLVFDTGIGYSAAGAAGTFQALVAVVILLRVRRFRGHTGHDHFS